jgi:hypothetical protein
VIKRHSERTYRVYMLGFVPGFAYMGRVDPSIAAPRHRVPRERVRAGSVGIAGLQTGVYPVESPGGWQLIGHTTTIMFDPGRDKPSLLAAGDWCDSSGGTSMTGAALHVVKAGLLTTVQDLGRYGHQASGVPVGRADGYVFASTRESARRQRDRCRDARRSR